MGQYGKAAIKAAGLVAGQKTTPQDAWKKAIRKSTASESSQKKPCPRSVFLGLCEGGMIDGVDSGEYDAGEKNKAYAIEAVRILQKDKSQIKNKTKLWKKVMKELGEETSKSQNNQMDVVTSLWSEKLIAVVP